MVTERKIYPEIGYNLAFVDNQLYIDFVTFCECDNGERIKVYERHVLNETDPKFIIEFVNRFHIMCQKYIKEKQ